MNCVIDKIITTKEGSKNFQHSEEIIAMADELLEYYWKTFKQQSILVEISLRNKTLLEDD